MAVPIFVVDAFSERAFSGNPAGVCLLSEAAPEDWMQSVATEMRHAETAFLYPSDSAWSLRWFTPKAEIDLCGHATLASAHVLIEEGLAGGSIAFDTMSGRLFAKEREDGIALDFPAEPPAEADLPAGIGVETLWTGVNRMAWFALLGSEQGVRNYTPDLDQIESMGRHGLVITAPSDGDCDFVSRFFAPAMGVDEDPVTGSAHCGLGPFWSSRLGKDEVVGYQASERGGFVRVKVNGNRVDLVGHAVTILRGELAG